MITLTDYLMGRDRLYPLSALDYRNAADLLSRVNHLIGKYSFNVKLSSGYRPLSINENSGGSKTSAHIICMAIDLLDPESKLGTFLSTRPDILEEYGLFLERPDYTKKFQVSTGKYVTWCHLQTRPTKNRIFIP